MPCIRYTLPGMGFRQRELIARTCYMPLGGIGFSKSTREKVLPKRGIPYKRYD